MTKLSKASFQTKNPCSARVLRFNTGNYHHRQKGKINYPLRPVQSHSKSWK